MADAAAKEPSMDDILSSIRKIIAEEGHYTDAATGTDEDPSPVRESEEAHRNFSEEVFKQAPPQASQPQGTEAPAAPQAQASAPTPDMKSIAAQMSSSIQEPQPQAIQPQAQPHQQPQAVEPQATKVEIVEMSQATKAPTTPFVAPTQSSIPFPGENRRTESPVVEQAHQAAPVGQPPASVEEMSSFKGALMSPSSDSAVSNAFDRLKRSSTDDLDAKTEAILRPMLQEWLDENLPTMVERLIREEIERVARGV